MSNILINWNTSRLMQAQLHKLQFLTNLEFAGKQHTQFLKFRDYVRKHYRELEADSTVAKEELVTKLVGHLDTVQNFQEKVASGQYSAEQIGQMAMANWKTDKVTDGCSIDLDLMKEFRELLEWAEPLSELFNRIPILTGNTTVDTMRNEIMSDYNVFVDTHTIEISEELEKSLKFFMTQKGIKH